jgi:hypothetical protein
VSTSKSALGRLRARLFARLERALPRRLAGLFTPDAQYTIGFGPSLGAGLVVGGAMGGGLFFNRDAMGHYGTVQVIAGAVANASAGMHVTLVKGGPEDFFGVCHVVGLGVSPAFTFVTALYTPEHELLGVSIDFSLGHALPVEACVGALKTYGRAWASKTAKQPSVDVPIDAQSEFA